MMATKEAVVAALKQHIDKEKAVYLPHFFKTGKGEYGEGDKFLGVAVPNQRRVAKQYRELPRREIAKLLDDANHECRLTALLILVEQFNRAEVEQRKRIVDLYLRKMDRVNNWDLVDATAEKILGVWLDDKDRSLLDELATSGDLWKQRRPR